MVLPADKLPPEDDEVNGPAPDAPGFALREPDRYASRGSRPPSLERSGMTDT